MHTTARQKKSMLILASYLVEILMKKKELSRDESLELLLQTAVYAALMDAETGLYAESRESILDMLMEELSGNPYRLVEIS